MRASKIPAHLTNVGAALLGFVVVTAALLLVYWPGLAGPFVFDDLTVISQNGAIRIQDLGFGSLREAARSGESGILGRPLAMISFALNGYFSGSFVNTFTFKTTNLVIHAGNSCLIFILGTLIFRRLQAPTRPRSVTVLQWISIVAAACWALHPIQLTSVLYTVQRMASLSALCILSGLIVFFHGRERLERNNQHGFVLMAAGIGIGSIAGLGFKENAMLLPVFAIVVELTLFTKSRLNTDLRKKLRWFYGVVLVVPVAIAVIYMTWRPDTLMKAYEIRDFSIGERLLTQPRVLFYYLQLAILPVPSHFSLFHDDFIPSKGLFEPVSTALALVALVGILLLAIVKRRSHPLIAFAIFWFLAGHLLESSILGLELVHEHRNYIAMYGPILALTIAIHAALRRHIDARATTLLAIGLASALGLATAVRAENWSDEERLIRHTASNHPNSARSQGMLAELYMYRYGRIAEAIDLYRHALDLAPNETAIAIRLAIADAHMRERPISDLGLSDTIEKNLKQGPIRPNTRTVLAYLSSCIAEKLPPCLKLYPEAKNWFRIAAQNPSIDSIVRLDIVIMSFNTAMANNDFELALEIVANAKHISKNELTFDLMRAEALMALGCLTHAENILAEFGKIQQVAPDDLRTVYLVLNARLEKQRAQKALQNSPHRCETAART